MNVNKRFLKTILAAAALLIVGSVHAGSGGVFYYYGLGGGGVMIDEATGYYGLDAAPTLSAFMGVEEDGWALEYQGLRTTEAGTDVTGTDWKASGSITSLSYRTMEENGKYYKIAAGKADIDIDLITNVVTSSGNVEGNVYTLGWGMRLRQNSRLEVDYSYYDPDSNDAPFINVVHMLSLRYMWGGAKGANSRY